MQSVQSKNILGAEGARHLAKPLGRLTSLTFLNLVRAFGDVTWWWAALGTEWDSFPLHSGSCIAREVMRACFHLTPNEISEKATSSCSPTQLFHLGLIFVKVEGQLQQACKSAAASSSSYAAASGSS